MDRRKHNGGNSTISTGIDRRKNQWRDVIDEIGDKKKLKQVFAMLHEKAIKDKDVKAAQLYLAYLLGKPTQHFEIENKDIPFFPDIPPDTIKQ